MQIVEYNCLYTLVLQKQMHWQHKSLFHSYKEYMIKSSRVNLFEVLFTFLLKAMTNIKIKGKYCAH